MKPAENIKRLIKNARIKTNPMVNEAVFKDLINELDKSESIPLTVTQLNVWRIIMKKRITKLAAAAVVIIAVVLSITLLDKSTTPAYGIEETIQAYGLTKKGKSG